ncbi:hypothetical protein B0J17DRAFT_674991 [Rhizoctonia solani]|nr:hypothetical protein B0J17DRAFT_674991 [Rhizoctonia solani]
MLLHLYTVFMLRLGMALAWPISFRSIVKDGDKFDDNLFRRVYSRGVSSDPRWNAELNILSKRNIASNLIDPAGNDIPDGDITNEDVSDILMIVLGVAVIVLLLLIVLALLLAYREQRKEAKYKEISDSDDGT